MTIRLWRFWLDQKWWASADVEMSVCLSIWDNPKSDNIQRLFNYFQTLQQQLTFNRCLSKTRHKRTWQFTVFESLTWMIFLRLWYHILPTAGWTGPWRQMQQVLPPLTTEDWNEIRRRGLVLPVEIAPVSDDVRHGAGAALAGCISPPDVCPVDNWEAGSIAVCLQSKALDDEMVGMETWATARQCDGTDWQRSFHRSTLTVVAPTTGPPCGCHPCCRFSSEDGPLRLPSL